MTNETQAPINTESKTIKEGTAIIEFNNDAFYNPVQEFNRDLSIDVIKTFLSIYKDEFKSKFESSSKSK